MENDVSQLLQKQDLPCNENTHVASVLQRIKTCRTAALGYHVYQCDNKECRHIKYQYHSCRDRHCPNCGAIKKQEWIEARMQELLPVKYYHVVFTLPHELNSLVMVHRKLLYKLLFDASSQTLLTFAKDVKYLGAIPGIISVLHICKSFYLIIKGEVTLPENTDSKQLFNLLYQKDWVVYSWKIHA